MDRQALHARRFGYLDKDEIFEAEIPSDLMSFLENRMNFQPTTAHGTLLPRHPYYQF